jgi:hypothetical protein
MYPGAPSVKTLTNEARVLNAGRKDVSGGGLVADLDSRRSGHSVRSGMPLERHSVSDGGVCGEGYVSEDTVYVR